MRKSAAWNRVPQAALSLRQKLANGTNAAGHVLGPVDLALYTLAGATGLLKFTSILCLFYFLPFHILRFRCIYNFCLSVCLSVCLSLRLCSQDGTLNASAELNASAGRHISWCFCFDFVLLAQLVSPFSVGKYSHGPRFVMGPGNLTGQQWGMDSSVLSLGGSLQKDWELSGPLSRSCIRCQAARRTAFLFCSASKRP